MKKISHYFSSKKRSIEDENDTLIPSSKRLKKLDSLKYSANSDTDENVLIDTQPTSQDSSKYTTDNFSNDGDSQSTNSILDKLLHLTTVNNEERHKTFSEMIAKSYDTSDQRNDANDSDMLIEENEIEEEEEEQPISTPKKKSTKAKSKYTPLELQYIKIRDENPDMVLFIEAGYRYRFFGKDAEIASKHLNIQANMSHNFLTASIPVHRLYVHARKLVQNGYKVGVVSQTETAALKAISSHKTGPFERELTHIYTKSTLFGEELDPLISDENAFGNQLVCVNEEQIKENEIKIAIVSIQTTTGDIMYDCFIDDEMRNELETRIKHIQPIEVLIPESISKATAKLIESFNFSKKTEDMIRIEKMHDYIFESFNTDNLINERINNIKEQGNLDQKIDDFIKSMDPLLRSCFGGLIHFLKEFSLDSIIFFSNNIQKPFTNKEYMMINGSTLENLEFFSNNIIRDRKGTLFSVIDNTKTSFGKRMLMEWLKKPLLDVDKINERLDAVEELANVINDEGGINHLLSIFQSLPDIEKGICRIYYGKCTVDEFILTLKSFVRIHDAKVLYTYDVDNHVKSNLLVSLLNRIPDSLHDEVNYFLDKINVESTSKDKSDLFLENVSFPKVTDAKLRIKSIRKELDDHLIEVRKILKYPSLEYRTLLKNEYTLDLPKSYLDKKETKDWTKLSVTKSNVRFHTPFIVNKLKELAQWQETLEIESDEAWKQFISEFSPRFVFFKDIVKTLAEIDCLYSLSVLSKQEGYTKPIILNQPNPEITIKNGRHPIIETLLTDHSYVPNDTLMGESIKHTCCIITGPNMGGKSSYSKQVAIICVLSQIGSFVPAEEAKITPIDAIFSRMGAKDNMFGGTSTFFNELQETSLVLKHATKNSLAILDELGRGTSTHDGYAIAYSTLKYIVSNIGCLVLFVTHYPSLSQLEKELPDKVQTHHISYQRVDDGKDRSNITFLYKLKRGLEERSFGMNVAYLARLPDEVIERAKEYSQLLEQRTLKRKKVGYFKTLYQALKENSDTQKLELTSKLKKKIYS